MQPSLEEIQKIHDEFQVDKRRMQRDTVVLTLLALALAAAALALYALGPRTGFSQIACVALVSAGLVGAAMSAKAYFGILVLDSRMDQTLDAYKAANTTGAERWVSSPIERKSKPACAVPARNLWRCGS